VYFSDFIRFTIFVLLVAFFGMAIFSVFGIFLILFIAAPIIFFIALL
jgi:hypothetical protein